MIHFGEKNERLETSALKCRCMYVCVFGFHFACKNAAPKTQIHADITPYPLLWFHMIPELTDLRKKMVVFLYSFFSHHVSNV